MTGRIDKLRDTLVHDYMPSKTLIRHAALAYALIVIIGLLAGYIYTNDMDKFKEEHIEMQNDINGKQHTELQELIKRFKIK